MLNFIIYFKKSIDKLKNILYDCKKLEGGVFFINLVDFFFIILIINSFVFFYSIYNFFNIQIFYNLQGSKLKLKNSINLK